MIKIFEANLCKCNNCDLLLVDKNPQVVAKVYDIFEDSDRQWVNSENIEVAEMDYFNDSWGCPICESDNFLIDI